MDREVRWLAPRVLNRPPGGKVFAVAMILGSMLSIQLGSAVAVSLFPVIGPAGAVFLRALIGALVLGAIWRPRIPRDRDARALVLLYGLTLAGDSLFFYGSITLIPLGMAVTFELVGPLSIAVWTSGRRRDWAWAAVAMVGIALLSGEVHRSELNPLGVLLAFIAGGFWGGYILLGKRVGATESLGAGGLAMAMLFAAVLTAPLGIVSGRADLLLPIVIVTAVAVGILSAAIPYSLELEAIRRIPPSTFGTMMSLGPAVAAVVGWVILGQPLGLVQAFAIILVIIASVGALA